MNVSCLSDHLTARTNPTSAKQRAEYLSILLKPQAAILELCVGPSLKVLEEAYRQFDLVVVGNDIELRWQRYYPHGKWLIANALQLNYDCFDAVVFAPPVTRGCTGKRCDSLMIHEVCPTYLDFIHKVKYDKYHGICVCVLPARALRGTTYDRREYYTLISKIREVSSYMEVIPLTEGRRHIMKYIDVYFQLQKGGC